MVLKGTFHIPCMFGPSIGKCCSLQCSILSSQVILFYICKHKKKEREKNQGEVEINPSLNYLKLPKTVSETVKKLDFFRIYILYMIDFPLFLINIFQVSQLYILGFSSIYFRFFINIVQVSLQYILGFSSIFSRFLFNIFQFSHQYICGFPSIHSRFLINIFQVSHQYILCFSLIYSRFLFNKFQVSL